MIATDEILMTDLSQQKRFRTRLDGDDLSPDHTVDHAVEVFLDRMRIPANGLVFPAYSRGVRLDRKTRLGDLPETDNQWTVAPEVSAG